MFEEIKFKFGKYKGVIAKDVPDSYLNWAIKSGAIKGKLLFYAKKRLNYPKDKYEVTVEDSANSTDGVYIVEAYNSMHAIDICRREYNVQSTQSYHGTSYGIRRIPNDDDFGKNQCDATEIDIY